MDGPLQSDRVGTNECPLPLHDHGVVFPIDAGLEITIDGLEEVIAMTLRMEAENAAAQQALQQFVAPRAYSHPLRAGPRYVPESDHGCCGQASANHRGREGEVIVLYENDGIFGVHFTADRVGEFLIYGLILPPIFGAEYRTRVRHVAKRPQAFIRKPIVVSLLLLLG